MQHVLRYATLLVVILAWPLRAEPPAGTSEYKQLDAKFYAKGDVLRANPNAVILTPDAVTNLGGSYLVAGSKHPARVIYLLQLRDWIEPITPPSMPASLNIPSDAMQVREPQGNVQIALPAAPADFHTINDGMPLPNGAVLKTGDNGSVAVLFGGVASVRLAPNSQAAVQMAVADGRRDVEVDIHNGIVFSKVGQRIGEKESYAVHTPFGTATAHGTDFVTVVLPERVDVWVASGTVGLVSAADQKQIATVTGIGGFKVMRFPATTDKATTMADNAETLTAILNFIPMANQKLRALNDRTRSGAKLTATEQAYVGRIRKVPALVKLESLAPVSVPVAPIVPLTPPGPSTRLPTPLVAPPPPPKAKPVVEIPAVKAETPAPAAGATEKFNDGEVMTIAPKAKPVVPPQTAGTDVDVAGAIPAKSVTDNPSLATTSPAGKPKPKPKKASVVKTPATAATKPAVAKSAQSTKTKPAFAKTSEKIKPKVKETPAADGVTPEMEFKPSPDLVGGAKTEPVYLRAKPVSATELTGTPPPSHPKPAKSPATYTDPNSLGSQLTPYAGPASATPGTVAPKAKPVGGSTGTVP